MILGRGFKEGCKPLGWKNNHGNPWYHHRVNSDDEETPLDSKRGTLSNWNGSIAWGGELRGKGYGFRFGGNRKNAHWEEGRRASSLDVSNHCD